MTKRSELIVLILEIVDNLETLESQIETVQYTEEFLLTLSDAELSELEEYLESQETIAQYIRDN